MGLMPFENPVTGGQGALVRPAIKSPGYTQGVTGWSINRDGSAEFNNLTIRGSFFGVNFVLSSLGLFLYSGAPATGNLIASIAPADGANDGEGNKFFAGFVSYNNITGTFMQINDVDLVTGFIADQAAGFQPLVGFSTGNDSLVLESGQQPNPSIYNQASLELRPRTGFGGGVSIFGGAVQVNDAESGGQLLTIQNNSSNPTDSNLKIINASGNDNSIGIAVAGRAFNSLKVTDQGILAGSGTSTQDTQFLRSSAGNWNSDTILANVGGSPDTWHSLGTLAGATVNKARYRFTPDGFVHIQIDVTFGVSTAAPITFSNTLPVAYRPLAADVDVREPMAFTNSASGLPRLFVGQASGTNPGAVQLAAFANVIGTFSCNFRYPVI